MEVALPGPLALDCEDMFKEITKKLYGEEGALEFPDRGHEHEDGPLFKPEESITAFGLAALMQNGFPPPGILHANFQPKTNPAAEDKWTPSEEALQWTASRIASYNPAQKLFKCAECECVGFLSRVAEHWLGTHSNARVFQCPQCAYGSAWARCVRLHLVREHNLPDDRGTDALVKNNPVLEEVTKYLQRLKAKVDGMAPLAQGPGQGQVQGTAQGPPAAAGRAPASPPAPPAAPGAAKRYGCPACPYATDRRDLFTRHENIHRDEKPFECYVCQKQFNRADHVKKHFLRMHRDHPYDLNRIRRQIPKSSPGNYYPKVSPDDHGQAAAGQAEQSYSARPSHVKAEHVHQIKSEHDANLAKGVGKKKGEKRYTCCYCPWSGVDNWCLKRHLNTHLKPFVCALCDYKAARSERLATHVSKVHNKKACGKCSFLAEDQAQLAVHLQDQHHVENRNIKVPSAMLRPGYSGAAAAPAMPSFGSSGDGGGGGGGGGGGLGAVRAWRAPKQQGAARLFNYMEASDGSDQDDFHDQDKRAFASAGERGVQDFPEAGDVGTAAEEVGESALTVKPAAPEPPVASPADTATTATTTTATTANTTKRCSTKKKRVPKNKKFNDKENEKSKFTCNICSASLKTQSLLNEHSKLHSCSTLRSPLLAANSAAPHFVFDLPVQTDPAWELDEHERQRRSRKQSQPKKIVQPEMSITVDLAAKEPGAFRVPAGARKSRVSPDFHREAPDDTKVCVNHPVHVPKQIDQIISQIVQKKEKRSEPEPSNITYDPFKKKAKSSMYTKLQQMLAGRAANPRGTRGAPSLRGNVISRLFLRRLTDRRPFVVFKCKRCRLKFKHKYEIYLHYKHCKNTQLR